MAPLNRGAIFFDYTLGYLLDTYMSGTLQRFRIARARLLFLE